MILKRKDSGYIRINTSDCTISTDSDMVEIEIVGYIEEPAEKDIPPMIPYAWTQEAPFNAELPYFEKEKAHAAPGCTQISLAMVAAYYGNVGIGGKTYQKGIDKTAEYISKKGTAYEKTIPSLDAVPAPPEKGCFDYKAFDLKKAASFNTAESKAAVAKFLKHICYSDYTSFGVTASSCSLSRALSETINKRMHLAKKAYIIYSKDGLDTFKEKILEELKGGHPVLMAASGTKTKEGVVTSIGHTFICDGWRASDKKYHLNLGMAESANGYYDLENIIITIGGITWDLSHTTAGELSLHCIINLHPEEL